MTTTSEQLSEIIAAYNEAWNAHDVERIGSMHAPDMVFENHTAGERAKGDDALDHIARIFESWPDIAFETRRGPGMDGKGDAREASESWRHRRRALGRSHRVERHRRHPVRGREDQAQGRLLGLCGDPAPGWVALGA